KRNDANLVVGAVLLIAVMVTVSVIVDAWSGKAAHSAQTDELLVSSFNFSGDNTIVIIVENMGTIPSGITEVCINNEKQQFTENSTIIQPNDSLNISIVYAYSNDTNYHFKLVSERGSTYLFTATAL
ncbi:MAG: hypothetical protein ACWGNP_03695, partial [Candidatus Bathyarchaeia archaeon]